MRTHGSIWALVLVLGLSQAARGDDFRKAKEHHDRGTTAYDLQRFAEAAREYELAYEAKNDPALLFNIGQAYRFAGEHQKAIGAFRSYLRRTPRAQNRVEVEARIAEMQRLLDEQKQSRDRPPTGTIVPAEPEKAKDGSPAIDTGHTPARASAAAPGTSAMPGSDASGSHAAGITTRSEAAAAPAGRAKKVAGLVVAALGVAMVAAGGASYGIARSRFDALDHPAPGTVFDPAALEGMKTAEGAGLALLGVGGAALVSGVVVAVLGFREGSKASRASLTPLIGRGAAGVSLQGSF